MKSGEVYVNIEVNSRSQLLLSLMFPTITGGSGHCAGSILGVRQSALLGRNLFTKLCMTNMQNHIEPDQ